MLVLEMANGLTCLSTADLPSVLYALVFGPGTCLRIFLSVVFRWSLPESPGGTGSETSLLFVNLAFSE